MRRFNLLLLVFVSACATPAPPTPTPAPKTHLISLSLNYNDPTVDPEVFKSDDITLSGSVVTATVGDETHTLNIVFELPDLTQSRYLVGDDMKATLRLTRNNVVLYNDVALGGELAPLGDKTNFSASFSLTAPEFTLGGALSVPLN